MPKPLKKNESKIKISSEEIISKSRPINFSGNVFNKKMVKHVEANIATDKIRGIESVPVNANAETKGIVRM